ncbi:MAG: class I SAM-dependent methyltransferase [Pseudomonadota bacterium]
MPSVKQISSLGTWSTFVHTHQMTNGRRKNVKTTTKPRRKKVMREKVPFRPNPKHIKADTLNSKTATSATRLAKRRGEAPKSVVPSILETSNSDDFALLDSGYGRKLERYGSVTIVRPEAQAVWPPALPEQQWNNADAVFTGDVDEEGAGRWRKRNTSLNDTWHMAIDGVSFLGRFTAFRHVGVFAEQIVHWRDMAQRIQKCGRPDPVRVLNLFGYTGVASLYAAAHNAHVTHVDASKKAIGWARENQTLAQLDDKPIRWICDDAMKFVEREVRRGNTYDIILLDPPVYGRGPNGEVWQLFDHLPTMMAACRDLLSKDALAMTLTAYAIRSSLFSIHEIMMETMTGFTPAGTVTSGELVLRDEAANRFLSTSMYSRWSNQ